uniref:SH3 domain-containing protein n=1 Tax=Steinernema glaseri TaxID=37863 RepID=A0A1I8AQ44_9BILA
MSAPRVVAVAKYPFAGRNNDELSFGKNEVITITQQLDGGWWEGTLNGVTGWFPSNHAVVVEDPGLAEAAEPPDEEKEQQKYRKQLILDLVAHETEHIVLMDTLVGGVLAAIHASKILTDQEYAKLTGNIEVFLDSQKGFLVELGQTAALPTPRIGGTFLKHAEKLKHLLRVYCRNHPVAVEVLSAKSAQLTKVLESSGSNLKALVTGLSEPFRHLEKYPAMFQEMERSMPESDPDRGDMQRVFSVYSQLKEFCTLLRRQRETQLEFLSVGHLQKNFSEREMAALGEIVRIGFASVGEEEDAVDRCLVLTENTLLVLQPSEKGLYELKERLPVENLTVTRMELKNGFTLSRDSKIVLKACVLSYDEAQAWMEAFGLLNNVLIDDSCTNTISPIQPQHLDAGDVRSMAEVSPLRKPQMQQLPSSVKAELRKKPSLDMRLNHELEMILPEGDDEPQGLGGQRSSGNKSRRLFSGYSLRPLTASRGPYALSDGSSAVKMRKGVSVEDQEDAVLLRIGTAYFTPPVPQQTPRGTATAQRAAAGTPAFGYQAPQLIVAEDEKILVEEVVGDEVVVQEKSLVDTVYALTNHMNTLLKEVNSLSQTLAKEQKARRRLEEMFRQQNQSMHNLSTSTKSSE